MTTPQERSQESLEDALAILRVTRDLRGPERGRAVTAAVRHLGQERVNQVAIVLAGMVVAFVDGDLQEVGVARDAGWASFEAMARMTFGSPPGGPE